MLFVMFSYARLMVDTSGYYPGDVFTRTPLAPQIVKAPPLLDGGAIPKIWHNLIGIHLQAYALNHASREAWADWLSHEPWDVFVTLTDPGLSHPEHMAKRFRYFENSINRTLYGNKFRKKGLGIETVVGLERQARGSVHAHGLVRLPDHDARNPQHFSLRYWQKFATDLGGWARLDVPRNSTDVVAYVTKYVCKEGDLILGRTFNPNNPRTVDKSLLGRTH